MRKDIKEIIINYEKAQQKFNKKHENIMINLFLDYTFFDDGALRVIYHFLKLPYQQTVVLPINSIRKLSSKRILLIYEECLKDIEEGMKHDYSCNYF